MLNTLENQAIAFAGLTLSAWLVQQLARKGTADGQMMTISIASTLKIDADDVPDVYGGIDNIIPGMKLLVRQLGGSSDSIDTELTRYLSTIVALERQLIQQPHMLEIIHNAVTLAANNANNFSVLDDTVITTLADAYQNTLSQFSRRVIINGEQSYLSDPDIAKRIRALLLAAIRSTFLWRQCGGSRFKLVLYRNQLLNTARRFSYSRK